LEKLTIAFLEWGSTPKRMGMTNGGGNIVRSADTHLSLYLFGGTNQIYGWWVCIWVKTTWTCQCSIHTSPQMSLQFLWCQIGHAPWL